MNILFIVTSFKNEKGGHYYSVHDTIVALSLSSKCYVFNIGAEPSLVLSTLPGFEFCKIRWPFVRIVNSLLKYIRKKEINVIHAFDQRAYLFARIASLAANIPIVLTQAGGPSPVRYFPRPETLITFSQENTDFFRSNKRYRKADIVLIPNRVLRPEGCHDDGEPSGDVSILNPFKDREGDVIVIRIARIGNKYAKSIELTYRFTQALKSKNISASCFIIGYLEDNKVYEALRGRCPGATFLTDDQFTVKASKLIKYADIVVGVGRSAVEAMLMKKIVVVPVEHDATLELADQDSVVAFAEANLSGRSQHYRQGETLSDLATRVSELIQDPAKRLQATEAVYRYAATTYEAQKGVSKWLECYENARPARLDLVDMTHHYYVILKKIIKQALL